MNHKLRLVCGVAGIFLVTTGCATKKFVAQEVAAAETAMNERVDEVETLVERNQSDIAEQEQAVTELSKTAREALDRAVAAGKLAEGKFLYETVLTESRVRFEVDKADLDDSARGAIDEFAGQIKAKNQDVFIEIQGHTDSRGSEAHNEKLGLERAESVRRYLSAQHGFALHRMSTISYGESEPVASNDTREERALNRRVALVVLQ